MGQWSLRLNKGNLRKPDQREKLQSDQSRLIILDILKSSSWPATGPTLNFPTKFILMVIICVSSANKDGINDWTTEKGRIEKKRATKKKRQEK